MHRRSTLIVRLGMATALALMAGQACGQSFNIDIDGTAGASAGVPVASFGAAAGQPGVWNSIKSASPTNVALVDLAGNATGVTITRATNGTFAQANSVSTSGAHEDLLDDYQVISVGTMTFTINNLSDGHYIIYTYGAHPQFSSNVGTINVPVGGEYAQWTQYIGGDAIPVNGFKAGITHAVHSKYVALSGPITINVADNFSGEGVISGIQIVKIPAGNKLRVHVNDNAAGNSDGTTWANAVNDLQDGLDIARRVGGPQSEVWVAQGFYYPTSGADRSATFSVPSGLELLGGFNATETTYAQRSTTPLFYGTYLSGAIGGSAQSDNSYVVVTFDNVNSNTLLDGFYVARGNNNGGGLYSGRGAGLTAYYAIGAMVRNCNFIHNLSTGDGAGAYLKDASMQFVNCTFYNNEATNGAGGGIVNVGPISTTLTLQNCKFLANTSFSGGAVYLNFTHGDFANCLFSGNHSNFTGGAVQAAGDTQKLTLINCTVSKNDAATSAGGVYVSTGMDCDLRNSILWGNSAPGGTTDQQQITVISAHGSVLTKSYSTIQGIDADPKFVDADGANNLAGDFDDDCRLTQGSPCIDAADAAVLPLDSGDVNNNGTWNEPLPFDLSNDPRRVEIVSVANTGPGVSPIIDRGAYEFQINEWCYANCDNSAVAPVLNVNDFVCFQNKFSANDPYANCDGSTTPPILNVNDFTCFLNKFAAGCP
ncbi:MAG: GC-type dockerin domain-anchored protein [Phycisphaerales bacterium]